MAGSTYPSVKGMSDAADSIVLGYAGDWASATPATVVGKANTFGTSTDESSVSSNGGSTWSKWASVPANNIGGSVAASTTTNWVYAPNNNSPSIYCTTNGGSSWAVGTGLPTASSLDPAWGFAYFLERRIVAADRVTANKFYVLNNSTTSANAGIWTVSNCGTWAHTFTGYITNNTNQNFNAQLYSVPNLGSISTAGHLFYSDGQAGSGGPTGTVHGMPLYYSTNGGAGWTQVTATGGLNVWTFGFGAPAAGQTYPAIYIVATINGVYGVYRCINAGANINTPSSWTWTMLSSYPNGSFDNIYTITGDANTYGKVYVGFAGSGAMQGTFPFDRRRRRQRRCVAGTVMKRQPPRHVPECRRYRQSGAAALRRHSY